MQTTEFIHGLSALKPRHRGSVVTIGAFDGVHLGHQQLLASVVSASKALSLPSVVVLFEPQPNEYFNPESAPARLTRLREKVVALSDFGVDRVVCLKFDAAMRALDAESFIESVLVEGLGVKKLIVGDDFRFGSDRAGDFNLLCNAGLRFGFDVADTRSFTSGATRVSSTYIRSLLEAADLQKAEQCLGRPYSTMGRVIYGKQLGRTIGFPTMNVSLGRLKVPLIGVFAVSVEMDSEQYDGVANVGTRPTIADASKPILEVHVFDQDIDAYGKLIRVTYEHKLRDEMQFKNIEALKEQIALDVERAKQYLKERLNEQLVN